MLKEENRLSKRKQDNQSKNPKIMKITINRLMGIGYIISNTYSTNYFVNMAFNNFTLTRNKWILRIFHFLPTPLSCDQEPWTSTTHRLRGHLVSMLSACHEYIKGC
ncbi:hypothetical protein CDAR_480761 [Caerostris darwini]|uniref:Uncharacterized protein n=1 Tax=Caerostris darwini TaxID=1538125 RepID=A0AAV4RYN8_9ARAC|nr:hypothetical protein CDAR_480761 [Caerostris darwini]